MLLADGGELSGLYLELLPQIQTMAGKLLALHELKSRSEKDFNVSKRKGSIDARTHFNVKPWDL
jgi:hypothetical protein